MLILLLKLMSLIETPVFSGPKTGSGPKGHIVAVLASLGNDGQFTMANTETISDHPCRLPWLRHRLGLHHGSCQGGLASDADGRRRFHFKFFVNIEEQLYEPDTILISSGERG